MAQWHHLFGLLCVVCISFGALFLVFNSDFGDVCDYSEVIDSCSELKTYIPDMAEDDQSFAHEWKVNAQERRNKSEVDKCNIEKALLEDLQNRERDEALRLINKCMTDFKACVAAGYTTTTAPPAQVDCTACHRFCDSTKWTRLDTHYATLVGGAGYNGECEATVCPWKPQCAPSAGLFLDNPAAKCDACPCQADVCPSNTATSAASTTAPTPSPVAVAVTTTTATTTTSTTSNTTLTTTSGQTTRTTKKTTTTVTTTTTTTTSTNTTVTTTTTATTTSSTTTTTTSTTTTTTTDNNNNNNNQAGTTLKPPACTCPAGVVGTVIVGRPMNVFKKDTVITWDEQKMKLYQGVIVETSTNLAVGVSLPVQCRDYFSLKGKYWGLQPHLYPTTQARLNAATTHPDLGCGYSGTFAITCSANATSGNSSHCSLGVDISTCVPPTYKAALADCMTVTTTAAPYVPTVTQQVVPDWLTIEEENHTLASLPQEYQLTTMTSTGISECCVHVGSVCDPTVNFNSSWHIGPTVDGRWQPAFSADRSAGYFPTAPCDYQAQSKPRPCPTVKIKELSNAASVYGQWASCQSVCTTDKVRQELKQICNRTLHPIITQKEENAHQAKIDSMKAQKADLESWTNNRMRTVTESVRVIDCIADTLPRRYNGMGLPAFRNGYDKLPLHNQCRLHGCKNDQCLKVKQPCNVPFVHVAPEENCHAPKYTPSFTCHPKVGISSFDPMSIGFATAWIITGCIFFCAAAAAFIRQYSREQDARELEQAKVAPRPLTPVTETGIKKFGEA